jgi:hypothetical protein
MAERRESARKPLGEACLLTIGARRLVVTVENLSERGCLVHVTEPPQNAVTDADLGQEATFVLSSPQPPRLYKGEIIRRYYADGADHFALRFWKRYTELPRRPGEAVGGEPSTHG